MHCGQDCDPQSNLLLIDNWRCSHMEFIVEIIIQFFGELILQLVFELLAELGMHGVREVFRRPSNPWLAACGYVVLGLVAGGLSLWWHPAHFARHLFAQVVILILVPIAAGGAMGLLGAWRRRRGQPVIRLDRFAYGYIFALAMAIVRFKWGG